MHEPRTQLDPRLPTDFLNLRQDMSNPFMSKTGLLIIIMVLLAGNLCAQNYFVFLSAEDRQPFYVRLDSTVLSSSPDGHLILAPLRDSTYQLAIGLPGAPTSEQHYVFSIREKDQEFQLRRRSDAGWGLFDQQVNDWLTPEATADKTVQPRAPGVRKDDAFSRMMADVVGDTAVLYNTYAMEQALNDSPVVDTPAFARPPTFAGPPAHDSTHVVALSTTGPLLADSTTRPPVTVTKTESARTANIPPVQSPATSTVPNPTTSALRSPVTSALPPTVTSVPTPGGVSAVSVPPFGLPHTDSSLVAANSVATSVTRPDSGASAPSHTIHTIDSATTENRDTQTGAPLYRPAVIARLSERQTTRGLRQVYTDRTGGGTKADTIVVIIPPDTPVTAAVSRTAPFRTNNASLGQPSVVHKPHTDSLAVVQAPAGPRPHIDSPTTAQSSGIHKPRVDSPSTAQPSAMHKPRTDSPSLAQSTVTHKPHTDSPSTTQTTAAHKPRPDTTQLVEIHPIPAGSSTTVENVRPHSTDSGAKRPGKPEVPFINSDCHVFATDYDVDRLRMKMLETVKEEERIATARKAFKIKCYTTYQLRILSEVFGTDGGRFRFFEAAWPFAADAHFRELSSLLSDPTYTAKFKSLTGQ
jgi:hypothetical protein